MPKTKTKKPSSETAQEKRKTKKEKAIKTEEVESIKSKPTKYLESIGRRKTSVARIRIFTQGEKDISINKMPIEKYFPSLFLRKTALSPLEIMSCLDKFGIQILVKGGGISSQSEAIRHGLARALEIFNPEFRKRLKKAGFLTRDPRMRERKKFGLKRARKAPQWAKR